MLISSSSSIRMPAYTPPRGLGVRVPGNPARLTHRATGRLCKKYQSRRLKESCIPAASPDSGEGSSTSGLQSAVVETARKIYSFVDAQFLPVALLSALTAGYFQPEVAVAARDAGIGNVATLVIFILSGALSTGLQLRRTEGKEAMESRGACVLGLIAILLLTPLASKAILLIPLKPYELVVGLAVFCCMPTSLSANIALTGAVGGNTAMSILLTVTSNVAAVFTMPIMLRFILATSCALDFDALKLIVGLAQTVLLPLLFGAALRGVTWIRELVDGNKKLVRNLSTVCLGSVPFSQIGAAQYSGHLSQLTGANLSLLLAVIWVTLASLRALNLAMVSILQGGQPDGIKRAVVLAASQKTLPISVVVISQLLDTLGLAAGLAVLPCIFAHCSQVLMDSVVVSWWKSRDASMQPSGVLGQQGSAE